MFSISFNLSGYILVVNIVDVVNVAFNPGFAVKVGLTLRSGLENSTTVGLDRFPAILFQGVFPPSNPPQSIKVGEPDYGGSVRLKHLRQEQRLVCCEIHPASHLTTFETEPLKKTSNSMFQVFSFQSPPPWLFPSSHAAPHNGFISKSD